jgi:hypothetical protein
MKIERIQILIDMQYDSRHWKHNEAQVVLVINKELNDKVDYAGVLTRDALRDWFFGKGQIYKDPRYEILIASISILGKVTAAMRDTENLDGSPEGGETKHETTTKFIN